MRAIVTRHYKTLINAAEEILGWGDSPPQRGWKADVVFVGSRLRKLGLNFDAIYSSDLERARQTAVFHARRLGIDLVQDTPALNEVNYGTFYKKKKKWVAAHCPQYKTDPDFIYPEGESFRQMQARSVHYLSQLAEEKPQQTILVVAHAGVIRGLISHFLGLNYAEHLKHKVSHRYIGDFQFEGRNCVRYDEQGKPSGFVTDAAIEIPFSCPVASVPAISAELKPASGLSIQPVIGTLGG
jgi:broad specificity phosphatase PhoE